MQSTTMKLNNLLENLEEDDYNKAVSYIESLINRRKEQVSNKKFTENKTDIETIVASLTGSIPDTGKSLAEYRNERLKKYEHPY